MSAFSNIASNIFMPIDDAFGIYNREIVHELLVNIQNDFALSLEKSVDMSTLCMIEYRPGDPQCNKIPNGHLIFLSTQGDEWWRWAYQFSREYCHSLINGASTGEISGLIWFEETMCHLASIYQLKNLIEFCSMSPDYLLNSYKEVACHCLMANFGQPQYNCREYLLSVADQLAEPDYHREIYSNLSATMSSLFLENKHLWKIILHFGDMRKWNSLHELFEHLQSKASQDYAHTLQKLYNLLFS